MRQPSAGDADNADEALLASVDAVLGDDAPKQPRRSKSPTTPKQQFLHSKRQQVMVKRTQNPEPPCQEEELES